MKAGGNSVGSVSSAQLEVGARLEQPWPNQGSDYATGALMSVVGLGFVSESAYFLVTGREDSTSDKVKWGAVAGLGAGVGLMGTSFFQHPQSDARRSVYLAGKYTILAAGATVAASLLADGIDSGDNGGITAGAVMTALTAGILGLTLYDDIKVSRRRAEPGLLAGLVENLSVGPDRVGTMVRF